MKLYIAMCLLFFIVINIHSQHIIPYTVYPHSYRVKVNTFKSNFQTELNNFPDLQNVKIMEIFDKSIQNCNPKKMHSQYNKRGIAAGIVLGILLTTAATTVIYALGDDTNSKHLVSLALVTGGVMGIGLYNICFPRVSVSANGRTGAITVDMRDE